MDRRPWGLDVFRSRDLTEGSIQELRQHREAQRLISDLRPSLVCCLGFASRRTLSYHAQPYHNRPPSLSIFTSQILIRWCSPSIYYSPTLGLNTLPLSTPLNRLNHYQNTFCGDSKLRPPIQIVHAGESRARRRASDAADGGTNRHSLPCDKSRINPP